MLVVYSLQDLIKLASHTLPMKKFWPLLLLLATACKQKEYNADLLVKNALVYTVDSNFSTVQAFVVSSGKIIAVGDHCFYWLWYRGVAQFGDIYRIADSGL